MESQHLNKFFFEEILRDYLKIRNVEVLEVKKEFASGKGDNFLRELYRVGVRYTNILEYPSKYKEETVSFIVKLMSPNNLGLSLNSVSAMFRTELKTFVDVLPRIEKFVSYSLAPRLFCGNTNTNFIVMEDLATRGFSTQDRRKGLSLAHTILAIEKIALFHSGSVALAEEKPDLVRSFISGNIKETYPATFFQFLESCIQKLSEGVEKWNEHGYKQAAFKLKKIKNVFKARLLEVYKCESDEFCVLNHGDVWTSNIMFQHDEKGEPKDALFVDFQMPIYTSPVIDLQHFLAMCPEIGIRYVKDDYFLRRYLEILESTMKKIGCKTKPPTLEELKVAMYKRRVYTILTGLIYYPRSVNEDVETFDEVLASGDTNVDIFNNSDAIQALRKIVKIVNDRGYLDF